MQLILLLSFLSRIIFVEGLLSQLIGRVIAQFQQIHSFALHAYHKYVTGLRVVLQTEDQTNLDEDYLTRDEFNLHKMIIAVSKTSKVGLRPRTISTSFKPAIFVPLPYQLH